MAQVHITLTREATDDPLNEGEVLRSLEAAGAERIDARHLRRFGLVKAEVPQQQLDHLRALPIVQAVSEIGVMSAI